LFGLARNVKEVHFEGIDDYVREGEEDVVDPTTLLCIDEYRPYWETKAESG
jgi:hypothetical protein